MKKTVLLTALLVTVFSATAYTGYTGPEDQPHIMGSSGSSSASQSVSQNGTAWSMNFTERSAGPENRSTGVMNHSFENTTVEFRGAVQVPTPCYSLNAEVEEREDSSYLFNITSERTDNKEVCPQVISYREYNASFQAEEPFRLEVIHDGNSTANLTHPDYRQTQDTDRVKGPLDSFFNFLKGLF